MKNVTLFFLIAFLLSAGCQPSESKVGTAIAQTQAAQPTMTLTPSPTTTSTVAPTSTLTPTITPTATPAFSQFYTENFDTDNSSWSFIDVNISSNKIVERSEESTASIHDGYLSFELSSKSPETYAYYNRFTYKDVRIDAKAANLRGNGNFMTLICRFNPKIGWYEYGLGDAGFYWVQVIKIVAGTNKANRFTLAEGGADVIKQGHAENEFSLVCQENTLSILIDGKLITQIPVALYDYSEGYAGVALYSLYKWPWRIGSNDNIKFGRELPIKANFDWVKFSAP